MTLTIHIIIALLSIGLTTYAYIRPSQATLRGGYATVVLTLLSGFYLVWATPSHMLQACTSGLVYLAVVSVGIIAVRSKLARQETALSHRL